MPVTGDAITAERKCKDPFTFRSYARLLCSAHRVPPSHDRTRALYRRWLIIPFERTFTGTQADKSLRAKLGAELPGIFNRALHGLHRLCANEAFTEPPSVREALKAYVRANDNVIVFIEECTERVLGEKIVKKEFRTVYRNWCHENGERAVDDKTLKAALAQAGPPMHQIRPDPKGPWYWDGVKWNANVPPHFNVPPQPSGQTP